MFTLVSVVHIGNYGLRVLNFINSVCASAIYGVYCVLTVESNSTILHSIGLSLNSLNIITTRHLYNITTTTIIMTTARIIL
jgi:hypothetical protein